jgi:signal transduction histidine kinase
MIEYSKNGMYISKGIVQAHGGKLHAETSQARAANSALPCRKSTEPGTVP